MTSIPTFRLDDDGVAHVMLGAGLITARCGRDCRGRVVTAGRPCQRCLDLAAAAIVAGDDNPAAVMATAEPNPAAAALAALTADLGVAR